MKPAVLTLFFAAISLLPGTTIGQVALKNTKVTKEITMLVPEDFILMSRIERIDKYVSSREPVAMYTSEDRNIDFGINLTAQGWAKDDLELLKSFYKANILNLYTKVKFYQEEIRDINGRAFVIFEFVSTVKDEENVFGESPSTSKYTYIQYTLFNNQVMLFNFTSPSRMREKWSDTAKKMMESIKIDE